MSRTETRHGAWVHEAALRVAEQKGGWKRATFTIGEVAEQCDLSYPTIKKYLQKCVDFGSMDVCVVGRTIRAYSFLDK